MRSKQFSLYFVLHSNCSYYYCYVDIPWPSSNNHADMHKLNTKNVSKHDLCKKKNKLKNTLVYIFIRIKRSLQSEQRLKHNAATIICCLFWLPVCHTERGGDFLLQCTVVLTCDVQTHVCAPLPESTGRPARRRKTKQK